jgi:hemolysin activation/secretion protein
VGASRAAWRCRENVLTRRLIVLALLTSSHGALAAELPSAGSQLQQIPTAPAPARSAPRIEVDTGSAATPDVGDDATLIVKSLHVVGAHAFSEPELIAAARFEPGKAMNLVALRGAAAEITRFYRSRGYLLARADLLAQDVVDGAVTIAVAEGRYGSIVVRNNSNLSDGLAHRLMDGLRSGDAITIAPLESRLLQLADLPGVEVKSTLVPGASVGASDLIVEVMPGDRFSGSVDADNSGSRYTGAQRLGGTVSLNNPSGEGDVATLRAITSFDGLNYGRAAYQRQFGKVDAGVAYAAMRYELGEEFASLQAHGTARIASVYGRYPLLRSRRSNLFVQLGFDAKSFRDEVDATSPAGVIDKKTRVSMLSLAGDRRDGFGGGGVSSYSVTWTSGSLDLQSALAESTDASTARSKGHYDKLAFNFARLQNVTPSLGLYAALEAQLATKNLDVSEKLGLGGAGAVRAYPQGEAYVDEGVLLKVEARWLLPRFSSHYPGQLQAVGFLDSGTGHPNRNAWDAAPNSRTLSAGGIGLNWFGAGGFVIRASYAHKIGAAAATSAPDSSGRFWINAVLYF